MEGILSVIVLMITFFGGVIILSIWSKTALKSVCMHIDTLGIKGEVSLKEFRKVPSAYSYTKRLIDLLIIAPVIISISPIFIGVIIILKMESNAPIFVKSRRIGLGGKPFYIYKFRTMNTVADEKNGYFVPIQSPELTRVGKFLRRSLLDELPALFNVIAGDISIVGRSSSLYFHALLSNLSEDEAKAILSVKPGLINLSTLSLRFNEFDISKYHKYDLYYCLNQSFLLDLKLILGSVITTFGTFAEY